MASGKTVNAPTASQSSNERHRSDCDLSQSPGRSTDGRLAVCLMIDSLSVAGTERQLLHLIDQIDRTRIRPYLCLLDGSSQESQALEPTECPVLRLGVRSLKSIHGMRSVIRFAGFLREHQIDIIQPYFPDSTLFAFAAGRLAGVKHFVRNRRNLGYNQSRANRWLGRIYSSTSVRTATNSEACRQAIVEQESALPASVIVIPNGVDLDQFAKIDLPRREINEPHIGMLANLRPVKDPATFVRAAFELAQEYPSLKLTLAGDGPLRSELTQLIESRGLRDRFHLVGSVNNVAEFLASVDVAVLTSTSEGLSNSVIEYMAAARPIVVTNVGGNAELIEHELSGLLVEPQQPDQLTIALRRLISDRSLAIECGKTARRKALNNYGLRQQAIRFEELWSSMAERS